MHAYRPNHYEALGVPRNADAETIRAAWREQAKQLHPDLSDGGAGDSNEAFLRLQEAYDVLRDPDRRAHYDATLARETAMADAARQSARRPSRPPRTLGLGHYLAALGLVVVVTVGIVGWQIYFPPETLPAGRATVIAKVVRDDRPHSPPAPERPAEPGALTREVDHAVQAQIERVEAAKKKLEAQLSELEAHKPPPRETAPAKPPAMAVERVHCIGRGTSIVLTRDNGGARVSYDNGPALQPRISDLGTGLVLVSRIEPSNKIAIGFTRGDRAGTTLLMFDEAGKVQRIFNVECTAAAF